MNEFIILSHNDLDGISCNLVLSSYYHFDYEIHTNYNDIIYNLRTIETYVTPHTQKIFITDLNFSRDDFKELVKFTQRHQEIEFVFIDHHIYEENILDKLKIIKNLRIIHSLDKCATLLCYDFIKDKIKSNQEQIKKYSQYVNAYDIWLKKSNLFKVGWMLNTIFWEIKAQSFKYHIKKNNFEIPKEFINLYKDLITKKENMYNDLREKNLIIEDPEHSILIAFSDKFKAFFQMDYPQYEVHILPYQNSNNISIRFGEGVKNSEFLRDKILEYCNSFSMCISCGGHEYAFGITNDKDAQKELFFEQLDGIIKIVEENLEICL